MRTVNRISLALVVLVGLAAVGANVFRQRQDTPPPAEATLRGGQLIGSIRADPRTFNKFVAREAVVELVAMLTQGRLVRIDRATFELEPWLAESWDVSADGTTYTFHLRQGVRWSDGEPFTAADVVFSFDAAFDPRTPTVPASTLTIDGQPLTATATDAHTVVVTFPRVFGPGARLLDNLTILPKHRLEQALRAGTFAEAWNTRTPPAEMVGTGPFRLTRYEPGQRLVFERNPHYWRTAADGLPLPYLERIILEIVPDQNAELLRLTTGDIQLTQSEIRADDYPATKQAADQGRLSLVELGVGTDADAFWFNLNPDIKRDDPRFSFVQKREFRQAIAHAVDRKQFGEVVYLGAAVPVWGPITPGNTQWYSPTVRQYPLDREHAKALLASIGLRDRDGDHWVEDENGTAAIFNVLTQQGISAYERGTEQVRRELSNIGISVNPVPLEFNTLIERMLSGNYDAIYFRPLASDLDPALNLDLWLSSGSAHFWNLSQPVPATPWEAEIDRLMGEQTATVDPARRRAVFDEVQRIFSEELPVLYFAAPRIYYAQSARVRAARPSVLRPPVLWNAETLTLSPF